jgi:hypothetical protein
LKWKLKPTQLSIVYKALGGSKGSLVKFFGFTKVAIDSSRKFHRSGSSNAKETFALVFDYASEGPLLSYLDRALKFDSLMENWMVIHRALYNVAFALRTIHDRDIVHRYDLGWRIRHSNSFFRLTCAQ